MFTELKKTKWSYMFLAAIASVAIAALTTLFTTRPAGVTDSRVNQEDERALTGRHAQYYNNETTMRFIN